MRSRSRLHLTKLADFAAFCAERGWVSEPLKSYYEVLRMRHTAHSLPLLVHTLIGAKEHLTTYGVAGRMLDQYLKERA